MKEINNLEASKKLSDKELELVNGGGDGSDDETLESGNPDNKPDSDGDTTWVD